MKLSTIQQICKGAKRIELYSPQDGCQWIGDGGALYPLYNLPRMDGDSIFAMFDIPEGKRDKIHLWQHTTLPENACFTDFAEGEVLVGLGDLEVSLSGRVLVPLKTSHGAIYINRKYLLPFKDSENGVLLYERNTSSGTVYVAVKEGFLLTGIIFPYNVVTPKFVEELETLCALSRVAMENQKSVFGGAYEFGHEATLFGLEGSDEE